MSDRFSPGDILVFQIESGFGLMKVIGVDEAGAAKVWHVKAYRDLFMDIEAADLTAASPDHLTIEIPHVALTERAFESTQVSLITREDVKPEESAMVADWRTAGAETVDRSIRLLLGFR